MESDLRQDVLPQAPDLGVACGGELTQALSEESGVTANSSSSALCGDADSSLVQSMEWTDERHNLYLDLLERSFVSQLNHSKRTRGAPTQEDIGGPYLSSELPMENSASSDEVLQDGCWQKINFQRMKNSSDCYVFKSPWICHLVTGGNVYTLQPHASLQQDTKGVHVTACQTFSCGLAATSMQQPAHHMCHQNLVGGTAEVTDQNFVDEDGKRSSAYSLTAKRVRRSSADGSSNNQRISQGRCFSLQQI